MNIKRITRIAATGLMCLTSAMAMAALPAEVLDNAYQQYLYASQSDGDGEQGLDSIMQLSEQYPDEPVLLMLQGWMETIVARDALMPWSKMKWLDNGLAHIDKALSLMVPDTSEALLAGLPVDLQLKAQSGIIFVNVPDFAHRLQQGGELLNEVLNDARLQNIPALAYQHIQFYAAEAAAKEGNSKRAELLYRQVISSGDQTSWAQNARKALDQL